MLSVTVLTGGSTPERDVSLAGAAEIAHVLRGREHNVQVIDLALGLLSPEQEAQLLRTSVAQTPPSVAKLLELRNQEDWFKSITHAAIQEADVVFPVLHGAEVEGGQLQAMLEVANIRFVGSDMRGSLLAMDKAITKTLLTAADVPTALWKQWPASDADIQKLGFPLIVKPSRAGSTIGLSLVQTIEELQPAIQKALVVDSEILLERFIPGRELTVGILDDQALAVGEIRPEHALFDYECKYTPGMSEEIFPAELAPDVAEQVKSLALRVHQLLQLRHFSRIDFLLGEDGVPYCLEANTLPGLTKTSLVPQSAAAAGVPFAEFCDRLCQLALEVH